MDEFNKINKLYIFLEKYLEVLKDDASWGSSFNVPEHDLYARDYLNFAENQLLVGTTESLINCVSNLKRAVDCQIDTFYHTLTLYDVIKKRNLKFEKKLELLGAIGIFNSKSLTKLNAIRNKMEHEYSIPQIAELDLYFDLVSAFISNLETAIIVLSWDEKNLFTDDAEGKIETYFTFSLERGREPVMKAIWGRGDGESIEVKFEEYRCFAFYLRCLYLINIKSAFVSNKYVMDQISSAYYKLCIEFNKL
ncbi:hypothetical protein [Paenibacillus sp. 22594]|uniref:hypothetical protein n=1 Tax=Paenibacillus sp. 22594 TaxID=3453947 RepID=UPI003F860EFD